MFSRALEALPLEALSQCAGRFKVCIFYAWTFENGHMAAEIGIRGLAFTVFLHVFFGSNGLGIAKMTT